MRTLIQTLAEYEIDFLTIIANRWDVDLDTKNPEVASERLAQFMLENAAQEWNRLEDRERGAFQILLGSKDHKMPLAKYERLFGKIRLMGSEKREREKPHLSPNGIAEILYYRGLLALAFDEAAAGAQQFVYVAPDLAAALPTHETGYDLSQPDPFGDDVPAGSVADGEGEDDEMDLEAQEPTNVRRADTTLVDDLTTVLAYLQNERVALERSSLSSFDRQAIEPYFVGDVSPLRMWLIIALIDELGLAADFEGRFKPIPNAARRWLEQSRTKQVETMVEAWHSNTRFNELFGVQNLIFETGSWENDPRLIRQTIKTFLSLVPPDDWFALEEFILAIQDEEPDFQRPAGDYDSWYIRDAETDEPLAGFESWDRVDGAALETTLLKPMHWLGLVDLGEVLSTTAVRLTAYGRAHVGHMRWPERPDPESLLQVDAAGEVRVPRASNRYNRFQLARFTAWDQARGDSFYYQIGTTGFTQAEQQGIKSEHILTFLKRTTSDNVPNAVEQMITQWAKTGGANVSISQMTVLQTDTEEILDNILNIPELRRFLGVRLGSRAVVVRDGMHDDLNIALQEHGLLVDS